MKRLVIFVGLVLALGVLQGVAQAPGVVLGAPERVDAGVVLYRPQVSGADFPAPLAVQALAVDSRLAEITAALALGSAQGRGLVADAVRREGAVAGVNAGFFVLATGDPTGALRVDGQLVSDARLLRGAVALSGGAGPQRLTFGRARVSLALEVRTASGWQRLPLDGVDTVRRAKGVTLYTPRFGAVTGTAPGLEWLVRLTPRPDVSSGRVRAAGTLAGPPRTVSGPIPRDGAVLSFGGSTAPEPLARIRAGTAIRLVQEWTTENPGDRAAFAQADDVVGGAGLLVKDGRALPDWTVEQTSDSLLTNRHPRTLIGTDARGAIWLVTVDGRQPGYSAGVTMTELQRLAVALGLTNALNLDGGGSSQMVVGNATVNRPSDPIGPRAVSDVLLVRRRPGRPAAAPR